MSQGTELVSLVTHMNNTIVQLSILYLE